LLLQLFHPFCHIFQGLTFRVRKLPVLQFLVLCRTGANYASRNTDYGRMCRHGLYYDRTGANLYMVANSYVAQDLCSRADDDAVADRRMPFPLFFTRAAQRHALINENIVSDFGGLADDNAIAVIDEESAADACAGVDLDPGKKPSEL
jgi:hypothetical protein